MNLNVIIEITNTGYSAYIKELDIYTTGENVTRLTQNLHEGIALYYDPKPVTQSNYTLVLLFDFKSFFKDFKIINAKFLAEKVNINPTLLSQYINGKKKASEKQGLKILKGIHEIGKELSSIQWR